MILVRQPSDHLSRRKELDTSLEKLWGRRFRYIKMNPFSKIALLQVSLCSWASRIGVQAWMFPAHFPHTKLSPNSQQSLQPTRSASTRLSAASSLVVISPPGGVGEVAAVQAASMGAGVRWFVVSGPPVADSSGNTLAPSQAVELSSQSLEKIATAGGRVELAGASASSLLLPTNDPNSALSAVSTWCGVADSIVCTLDGVEDSQEATRKTGRKDQDTSVLLDWKNAIKVAAREASSAIRGRKIAIISANDDAPSSESDQKDTGGVGELVGSLLGGNKRPSIPDTLPSAMSAADDGSRVVKLRHGTLFGDPESSPQFSALVGGPKRVPELCEEYTMRSVRVDPTLSVSGNLMMGSNTRSSRHAVGEAASLLALGKVPIEREGLDVCVSSLRGSDPVPLDVWDQEFQRVQATLSTGEGAQLFTAEFSFVPDVKRLADWLATKWAPAILRTYDIAAIRVGARPVYATRLDDERTVEIVWQQLVDFSSVTVGKMVVQVSETGLVATRGSGDASKGFGSVSRKPLAGEDVLVRRLAEAVSQAIEKGLAKKSLPPKPIESKRDATQSPVTSIQDSGTIATAVAEPSTATTTATSTPVTVRADGPRQPGARRSTERKRGKRRREEEESKP